MSLKRSAIVEKKTAQGIRNPSGPRLLPLMDGAKYLGLSVWTVREAIWAGFIPIVRPPGTRKIWIDIQDLDAFIDQNKMRIT